jgi:uncharacterized caspase-like protein
VPVDVNERDVVGTCVSGEAVERALGNTPGRLIAMLDACHPRAVAGRSGRADELMRELVTDDYGVVCMCSSLGEEYSLDIPTIPAGVFTVALVEGLLGRADGNRDQVVSLRELEAYTASRVRLLTGGRQNPVTGLPAWFRSFPLTRSEP